VSALGRGQALEGKGKKIKPFVVAEGRRKKDLNIRNYQKKKTRDEKREEG